VQPGLKSGYNLPLSTGGFMAMTDGLEQAAQAIIVAAQRIHARGWVPATSGNFSVRLDREHCALTASGKDKGQLQHCDILQVDMCGRPVPGQRGKASAEALLHTGLYRYDSGIGAILHVHSLFSVLVPEAVVPQGKDLEVQFLTVSDLELLKAFPGITTHRHSLHIPVFENTQDIASLAEEVRQCLAKQLPVHAYLIRGHGLYVWGKDIDEAMRHLEAMDFLLNYIWQMRVMNNAKTGELQR
jgi:methylthioribulose-1-phosphate dehydratase